MELLKNFAWLLRQAAERWNADRAPRLSAALAYYATFSLAPLALVTIWIAGLIFGDAIAQRHLSELIAQNFGADSAAFVQSMIDSVYRHSGSPWFGLVALIGLLFGATGLFFGQTYRDQVVRHNLGLEEALYTALLAAFFFALGRRQRRPGVFTGLLAILYAPARFLLDFLRVGEPLYLGLTPGQWGSLLLVPAGIAVLVHSLRSSAGLHPGG